MMEMCTTAGWRVKLFKKLITILNIRSPRTRGKINYFLCARIVLWSRVFVAFRLRCMKRVNWNRKTYTRISFFTEQHFRIGCTLFISENPIHGGVQAIYIRRFRYKRFFVFITEIKLNSNRLGVRTRFPNFSSAEVNPSECTSSTRERTPRQTRFTFCIVSKRLESHERTLLRKDTFFLLIPHWKEEWVFA